MDSGRYSTAGIVAVVAGSIFLTGRICKDNFSTFEKMGFEIDKRLIYHIWSFLFFSIKTPDCFFIHRFYLQMKDFDFFCVFFSSKIHFSLSRKWDIKCLKVLLMSFSYFSSFLLAFFYHCGLCLLVYPSYK